MNEGPAIFPYIEAVARNLGWLTEAEQLALRSKRVAIAGLGGVGGAHLLTLVRLGVQRFHIADLDHFEAANINRQAGARWTTLGAPKVEVMAADARAINPDCDIRVFAEGIRPENLDEFLEGVDLFVDGFDFFEIAMRAETFARCREKGIPAITAAPIGMGTAYLVFTPDGMSFQDYFRLDGLGTYEQYASFLLGLTPRGLHRAYLVDPAQLNLAEKRGPSTIMGCNLAAGVVGCEALKLLLGRGPVYPAPYYAQFDAYRGRLVRGKLRFGNAGPLQRVKVALAHRAGRGAEARTASDVPEVRAPTSEIEAILDLGRWAPSGDNVQPWRFRVLDDNRVDIDVLGGTGNSNIYEFDSGRPTWISVGCLLETLRVAASAYGRGLAWERAGERITVTFMKDPGVEEDPNLGVVTERSVDRRPYRPTRLGAATKHALEAAVGPEHRVVWYESLAARWRMARLSARATDIRLRLPECYEVHRTILDWDRALSPDRIPAAATGLDALTRKVMRWALEDWGRASWMNAMPGSLLPVHLQLDWLPGLLCGAHFAVVRREPAADGRLAALDTGMALQRFWLTACRHGLAVQPSFAVQCFAYHGADLPSRQVSSRSQAKRLRRDFEGTLGLPAMAMMAVGRIGDRRKALGSRSLRRPLSDLLSSLQRNACLDALNRGCST